MLTFDVFSVAFVFGIAFMAALAGLFVVAQLSDRSRRAAAAAEEDAPVPFLFLFDQHTLVDANDRGRRLLATAPGGDGDWARLNAAIHAHFPNFAAKVAHLQELGAVTLRSATSEMSLEAEWVNGLSRFSLRDTPGRAATATIDNHSLAAMTDELDYLRSAVEYLPALVWRQAKDGSVTWANGAYLRLVEDARGAGAASAWPPEPLFDEADLVRPVRGDAARRISITIGAETPRWFEHVSVPLKDETLHMAISASEAVQAETALREFMQTLTKTFAHLTIGLAIFDKRRRLVLFNPALTELTALSPEFLSRRPSLSELLDQLRERTMMPEPKDYKSWRQQIAELEAAAVDGSYQETWTLPTGQTYRVTGRPHPDGAIAFLFEDISAEISLTRRFRAELETGQAVLDSLNDAIAVFSPSGTLTLSNKAYAELWGHDPSTTLGQISVTQATHHWAENCQPSPVWGDFRDFAATIGERAAYTETVTLTSGARLACRFQPIAGGASLAAFRRLAPVSKAEDRTQVEA